jgi:uncharacterized protein YgbK (DUF1537 family)
MGHGTDPEHVALHPAHVISGSGDHVTRREVLVMTGRSPIINLNNGADIERIRPEEIKRAFERVMNTNGRYRFVIDTALLKA